MTETIAHIVIRPIAHRPRRGFSLIEILVVVGILAVLISLAVVGFKVVGGASRNRVTDTALENAKSLLAEFETTSTITQLLDASTVQTMHSSPFRWAPPLNGQPSDVVSCAIVAPDINPAVSTGAPLASLAARAVRERYLRDETARVIRRLMSVPKNRASVQGMPPDRISRVRFPESASMILSENGDTPEYPAGVAGVVEGPILLDGNNKPIYFVPGGGILYVNIGYRDKGDRGDRANSDRQVNVRASDRRPFWASGGVDGDLTTGDDNVYSGPVDLIP